MHRIDQFLDPGGVTPPFQPRPVLLLQMALYMLSLALPAMDMTYTESPGSSEIADLRGYAVLLSGWLMVPAGNPAWLANPLFAWVVFHLWRGTKRRAIVLIMVSAMLICAGIPALLAMDSGSAAFDSLFVGYWVWLASISMSAITVLRWWWQNRALATEKQS